MGDTTLRKKVKEGTEQIIGTCLCMRHDMPEDQWEEQHHMQIEYANQEEEEKKNSRSDRAVAKRYVPGESETAAANSVAEVRNWTTRHLRRSSCTKAQAKKKANLEAEEDNGLFVCNLVCPETGRYCGITFLTRRGYERHYNGFSSKHSWQRPGRIKSKDRAILLASRPGGPLAVGTLPDRSFSLLSVRHRKKIFVSLILITLPRHRSALLLRLKNPPPAHF